MLGFRSQGFAFVFDERRWERLEPWMLSEDEFLVYDAYTWDLILDPEYRGFPFPLLVAPLDAEVVDAFPVWSMDEVNSLGMRYNLTSFMESNFNPLTFMTDFGRRARETQDPTLLSLYDAVYRVPVRDKCYLISLVDSYRYFLILRARLRG